MTQNEIDHILQHISEGNKLLAVKELMDKAQISLKDSAEIINLITEGKESDLNVCLQRIKGGGSLEQPSSHIAEGGIHFTEQNKRNTRVCPPRVQACSGQDSEGRFWSRPKTG